MVSDSLSSGWYVRYRDRSPTADRIVRDVVAAVVSMFAVRFSDR